MKFIFILASFFIIQSNISAGPLLATLWEQDSAEYKALCYQAYNVAKLSLDKILKSKHKKPLAVVLDVDKTVLSHKAFQGYLTKTNKRFTKELWNRWLKQYKATAIPGAKEFTNYAHKKGVEVFYITNTRKKQGVYLLKRMQRLSFVNADNNHFFPRIDDKDKQGRRNIVSNKYKIVMYIGDQLTDMPGFARNKTTKERLEELEANKSKFGIKYIVLPNVTYGEWINALGKKPNKSQIKAWDKK